jgi:hypothetical protein
MENSQNSQLDNDKLELKKEIREKRLFYSMLVSIFFGAFIIAFIIYSQVKANNEKEELIKAFSSNQEIVCSSKVVSLNNGFKFDEKREEFVTNGVDIFHISICSLK